VLRDAWDDHVLRIGEHINNKPEESKRASRNLTTLNIVILVALNLADELIRLRGEQETICNQLETRSEELIHLIDREDDGKNIPLRCA